MPRAAANSEDDLLAHILGRSRSLARLFPHVRVGPGHDCAVVKAGSATLLLKVDQLVEGRHYFAYPKTPLNLIARKALARPLSDIAAAGGSPLCALAAAAIPTGFRHSDQLFTYLHRHGMKFACPIVGGDICTTTGPLTLSITVVGLPHPRRGPVLRSGARVGDGVFVTGALGNTFDTRTGRGKHLTFTPRLREARALCTALGRDLHAMMDISDGLGKDAARLAAMSGVSIQLDADAIPRRRGVRDWRGAIGGGEDYELLFAAGPRAKILPSVSGTRITQVGRVVKQEPTRVWMMDGRKRIDVSDVGWIA